jgi:hypothetical protein
MSAPYSCWRASMSMDNRVNTTPQSRSISNHTLTRTRLSCSPSPCSGEGEQGVRYSQTTVHAVAQSDQQTAPLQSLNWSSSYSSDNDSKLMM